MQPKAIPAKAIPPKTVQADVLPFSLKASGWFLSNLGSVFPGLTARLFFRLYTTPPKKKLRAAEYAVRQRATLQVVSFSKYSFDPRLMKITTYRWGGPGKKILLMHGWGGTPLSFQSLIGELVQEGYEVIAYDAPAHGYSEGRRTNLVQWIHILDQFLRLEGPVYAIIGHSVGALVSALTLARKGHGTPRLVLAAPPLSAPSFFQDTFDIFNIRPQVIDKVYRLIKTRLKDDLLTMDLHHCIGGIGTGRILVLYDGRDRLVKEQEIAFFLTQYEGLRSFRIEGEGHFRILKNGEVVRSIGRFLANR